jgi:membrane protein YdbS with pleckstrin-like domain
VISLVPRSTGRTDVLTLKPTVWIRRDGYTLRRSRNEPRWGAWHSTTAESALRRAQFAAADPAIDLERKACVTVACIPEEELILLNLKPSLWFILSGLALPALVCLAPALLIARLPEIVGWAGIHISPTPGIFARAPLVLVMLFVVCAAWQVAEWISRRYVLTDRRIVAISGVLRQVVQDIPLSRVQHVTMHRTLFDGAVGTGSILMSSAGSVTSGSEVIWQRISRPREVSQIVRDAMERYGRQGHHE